MGRYKVARLMREANLVSKEPGAHRYKANGKAHSTVKNKLQRQFDVASPIQVWCGDITYIWAGSQWVYLAVVIDLYARKVISGAISRSPDSALAIKALEMTNHLRGQPKGVMFHTQTKVANTAVWPISNKCGVNA